MSDVNPFPWQFVRYRPVFSPVNTRHKRVEVMYADDNGNVYADVNNNVYVDGIGEAQETAIEVIRYV
jgi:hypothetical protein